MCSAFAFSSLAHLLAHQAAQHPGRLALAVLGSDLSCAETLTFGQLSSASQTLGSRLLESVQPGDRVLLAFDNGLDAALLFWACMAAGVIAVPAPTPGLRRSPAGWHRLQAMCQDAQVAMAFCRKEDLAAARAELPQLRWSSLDDLGDWRTALPPDVGVHAAQRPGQGGDVAYLQYTSGSTGQPRGVAISHDNVLAQCAALWAAEPIDSNSSRSLVWLPWFHDYGLVHALLMPVYAAMPSYLMSTQQFLMRPLRWLEAMARYGITHCGAPDFAYETCVKALARQSDWSFRLDGWKLATCGAEPIRAQTLSRFVAAFEPFGFQAKAFAPSYGLAEAVLAVSIGNSRETPRVIHVDGPLLEQAQQVQEVAGDTPGARTLVGSGEVLPDLEVHIVQPSNGVPCEPDEVGEIWVRGPSVGRGYWDRPDASAERFGGELRGSEADAGRRFLRTGDLGFLRGRELYVTGRWSDLIVLNGRNVHPQDIEETVQSASPWIRVQGCVAVPVEQAGREQAVVLAECRRQITDADLQKLRLALRQVVAERHDLNLLDVVLLRGSVLPRTSSGKLQRRPARQMYLDGALSNGPWALHGTETPGTAGDSDLLDAAAGQLAPLWAQVLNLKHVPLDGHFLALGGDSLTGTQLLSRVREQLGVELPISALFAEPTLRGMARALADKRATLAAASARQAGSDPTTPKPFEGTGVSFSQERMWFMQSLAPETSAYNVPLALRLSGPLDAGATEQALDALVAQQEILRTRFVMTPQGLNRELVEPARIAWTRLDLTADGDAASGAEVQALVNRLSQEPFGHDRWPLLRAWLIRIAPDEHVLLLVLHHLVADQWSFAVMGKALARAYNQVRSGQPATLPPPPESFAHYANWHRRWYEEQRQPQEVAYWTQRLAGLRPVELPTDLPRPRQPRFQGANMRLPLPPAALEGLSALAASQDATLAMALLALFKVFLHRYSGQDDLAVGMPIANRHHAASEELVGSLVNTLVVRTSLDGDPHFLNVLRRVRAATLEAYEHQDMPFEQLVRLMDPTRSLSQSPLFNVMFNVVNSPVHDVHFDGLDWARMDVDRAAAQADLTMVVDPQFDRSLVLEYSTDLFRRETVQRMGLHLLSLLECAVTRAHQPVSGWPMLSPQAQQELLSRGRGPKKPQPEVTLAALLERGMAINPSAVALVVDGQAVSYRTLEQKSRALADRLRERGYTAGHRIGLCLLRGLDMLVALLAVVRAGATYVPLDPTYPEERLAHQIGDADLALVIATRSTLAVCRGATAPHWSIDEDGAGLPMGRPPEDQAPALAYLIYTSGSTGRPKGVAIPQGAVVNFLLSMAREPGLGAGDRVLAVTTLGFDISVLELLLPLVVGATTVLATEAQATDGAALKALIEAHDVSVMQATPSRWHLLLAAGWTGHPGFRALVGGESLSPDLAAALLQRCDAVWNMYGPTETTVWSTCWRVQAEVPIVLGHPIDNTDVLVLDGAAHLLPAGAWGEIWIGGSGLADGYWRQPELSRQRMRTLEHLGFSATERFYRTGDRGRWRTDGTLEHGGRLDDQVKLRGFRIELGEVQACIERQPGVGRCVVVVREDQPGDQRLVAYFTAVEGAVAVEALRDGVRQWLPEHMVPAQFVPLDELPTLPNGKVNRGALPIPSTAAGNSQQERQPPRSDIEWRVWHIWEELLRSDAFGIHDSFFDLGGHSILALRMIRQLETEFQTTLPLHLLFESPTVADIARHVQATGVCRDKPLVLLRRGNGPNGLFLLAGAHMYRELAHRLQVDMPVYGLFSQTEIDLLEWPVDRPLPPVSIDGLADAYLQIIRAQQPHGPYHLGGYSIGGVMAYEVAQRLKAMGEDVALLVMLDCAMPGKGWRRFRAGVVRRARMFRREGWRHLLHLYRQWRALEAASSVPGGAAKRSLCERHPGVPCPTRNHARGFLPGRRGCVHRPGLWLGPAAQPPEHRARPWHARRHPGDAQRAGAGRGTEHAAGLGAACGRGDAEYGRPATGLKAFSRAMPRADQRRCRAVRRTGRPGWCRPRWRRTGPWRCPGLWDGCRCRSGRRQWRQTPSARLRPR